MNYIESRDGKLYCGDMPFLLKGFGLGGWLLPEGYMWGLYDLCDRPRRMEKMIETLCGEAYASIFWEKYFDTYITRWDIETIAGQGYNSVRLPINARHLYKIENGQMHFNQKTIENIDQLIRWCSELDIYVILDMHGANGGQTGANIDDCIDDQPRLFMEEHYENELIEIWGMLAMRYKDEPAVAGYDLLNEPLPNWFSAYNHKLMPLYRKLISKIRQIDKKHLIILEGLHWATDFTMFDTIEAEALSDGIVLEFHKYWSNPDYESIAKYIEVSKRLNVPLFMGESGENNLDWYTTMFPLFDRINLSWSFWSYKKMSCDNSPITFNRPNDWDKIVLWAEQNKGYLKNESDVHRKTITSSEAHVIFDELLHNISNAKINSGVFNALKRTAPVTIPAESYDEYQVDVDKKRSPGADIRSNDPVEIIFENGNVGAVNYTHRNGSPQLAEENLLVKLNEKEALTYYFNMEDDANEIVVHLGKNQGMNNKTIMTCSVDDQSETFTVDDQIEFHFIFHRQTDAIAGKFHPSAHKLKIECVTGILLLDDIEIRKIEK